ncbi:MAG: zinc-dependent metalloprotease [Microbacterium sp.]|uniref:zinc-dependent metalloprotease n=1 Tax=Microbacterium sp. TaxID=51671 RepID=UPI003A861EE7
MQQLFGASGANLDPDQLSRLSGVPIDPAMMSTVMQHLQGAFAGAAGGEGGISWDMAKRQALHIANQDGRSVTDGQRTELDQAFQLAALWVSAATTIAELADPPRAFTRGQWVEATLPVWQELAEPVATSIADALTRTLSEQAPEELQGMVQGAGRLMRGIGGSLFAAQLGQVVGQLSLEVVSGGDVGIPVMPAGSAAILPQNFADFGAGLEVDPDQSALYIAARELAHARLFRHAKWLRLHVIAQVSEIARGTLVNDEGLEELATRFDPSEPEELRQALMSGELLRRSEEGQAALGRLENVLATIEGWVDVVTADATARLPYVDRLSEAARRRRAVGGPAERALGSLVGLELRPRRLREAAAMWRAVTDAVGVEARDALWDYPDLMPTSDDIDDPSALVARLEARARGEEPARDAFDEALESLLADTGGDEKSGGVEGDGPEDPRPV